MAIHLHVMDPECSATSHLISTIQMLISLCVLETEGSSPSPLAQCACAMCWLVRRAAVPPQPPGTWCGASALVLAESGSSVEEPVKWANMGRGARVLSGKCWGGGRGLWPTQQFR